MLVGFRFISLGFRVLTEAPTAGTPLLGAALYIDLSSQVRTLLCWGGLGSGFRD